ncbi:MAG: catecholate siderophore receptor Fiu, partial [Oxalicibacterium faecigallinarum]|uniref:catecholate siderophore receptor Fiu n=1 Tax=Oxalicibacterium faecigallinarum TaxID=573741 RepID=UPI0028081756
MSHIKSRKHPAARHLNPTSAAVALAIMAISGATFAQQSPADTTLPAVNVSGQAETYKAEKASSAKFTQPLVDTPQTITVIKKELLQDQGATTLTEALRNTPGVTMTMGENGNTTTGDSVFMRGFDTQGSIFVDGIRDLGTITRDVFNMEQVEIVKGPSGSDNGRGAPSGYINLESKKAKADNFTNVSVGMRSAGSIRATADLNRQFSENAAFRLNLLSDTGSVEDRDWVKNKSLGIAPSVVFGLNTPTRVTLNFLHVEQRNRPDGGIPAIGIPGYQPAAGVPAGASAVRRSNYYGSANDFNDVDANMLTAFIEHDITPNVTIRNTTRYGLTDQEYNLTGINAVTATVPASPSTWTVSRSRQGKDQRNEILTNQTNVTANLEAGGVKHALSGGVEFIYEKQRNALYATVAGQQAANLYNPSVNDVFQPLVKNGQKTEGDTTTVAAYLFDTIKINDKFQVNGGVRYEHYSTSFINTSTPLSLDGSDNLITWKAGAVYKPAQNGSVYIAYASSQKPPGSDNFSFATGNSVNNPNIEPQKATNLEVGTKWDVLDNRLALTAAIFKTENKNAAVQTDPVTNQPTAFGEQRVKGVELGMVGQITPAWQVSTGLARMDTETVVGTAATTGAGLNWSPKLTFTGWTTYKLPFGVTLGGGVRYVDSQVRSANAALPTTNVAQLASYAVYDAMASYAINKNVTLQLNIYNLADKFYVQSLNNGGSRFVLGQPRSAFLSANMK